MFRFQKSSLILGAALLVTGLATSARASDMDKKSYVTFAQSVEIPGAVLPPGQYVFKLVDDQISRHVVQITNADETEVYNTVITIPGERLSRTSRTVFSYYEMPAGQPLALKMWYYPGDLIGDEFAYPDSRGREISRITHQHVPVAALPKAASVSSHGD
jgi:hypothetical protein